jgi:hypothetical protein
MEEVTMSDVNAAPAATPVTRGPRLAAGKGVSAVRARHWFLVLAPTLAGLLAVVGAAADPAVGEDGAALYEAYARDPAAVQVKSFAYHFAYLLWGATALVLVGLVRRRGSWLANVAGVLALLGLSTMPGFLIADFYDSAIGREFGVGGALRIEDRMEDMWALLALFMTGALPFVLALPMATLAAWRAGVLPWWGPAAATAGIGGGFFLIGANVPGALVLTAGFLVLSIALARTEATVPPERGQHAATPA